MAKIKDLRNAVKAFEPAICSKSEIKSMKEK